MEYTHEWNPLWRTKWDNINKRVAFDPYYRDRIENEFSGYEEFYQFCLEHYPSSGCVIDRINPSGNYSPENCQFLTVPEHRIKTAIERRMFSSDQIMDIRNQYDNGVSAINLSERFGCTPRHIHNIVNRSQYKDIP